MAVKKVMIVDDDPRNIFALKATLQAKGFECISCTGAREALDILRGYEQIDAILMDMMMPDMDGYEAIPLIKQIEHRASAPVISVTAQAMVGDREKCIEAGADDYVSKPVDVDKLIRLLSNIG